MSHRCVSQIAIERYLLGELDGERRRAVEDAVAACAACREAVEKTRADEAAFALRPVPPRVLALWIDPVRAPFWRRIALVAVPVAAAAALAAVLLGPLGVRDDDEGIATVFDPLARKSRTRVMGSPASLNRNLDGTPESQGLRLGYYRLAADGPRMGEAGESLGQGDRIQFWYDAPASAPAAIVGIDGRGAVTRYYPSRAGAADLGGGRGRLVDAGVELDDAPGVERFFLCLGEDARDPAIVEAAARRLVASGADLLRVERLPLDCAQASVWIRKR